MSRSLPFEELAASGVRGLQPYQPGKPIEELARDFGIRDAIKLASNENPHGLSPAALEAIRTHAAGVNEYPDGSGFALRQSLAAHLGVAPEQITLGNGSNDVLVLLAEAFLTPATSAIYDRHAFIVYPLIVQACGAQARVAESQSIDASQPMGHDLDAFSARLDESTRLVFIANPNNPTGSWLSADELRAFLERTPRDTLVVVDEAYHEYADAFGCPTSLVWLDEFPNLVVTRTFSKAYGLAGLRMGYSVSHPAIAELLNRVRQPFNVNSLAQAAAIAALGDQGFVADSRRDNHAQLGALREGLQAQGFATLPSAGNFVLADMGGPAIPYYEALLRAGVIVRPVGNYGLPNHLRISVGLAAQNARLLGALQRIRDEAGGAL